MNKTLAMSKLNTKIGYHDKAHPRCVLICVPNSAVTTQVRVRRAPEHIVLKFEVHLLFACCLRTAGTTSPRRWTPPVAPIVIFPIPFSHVAQNVGFLYPRINLNFTPPLVACVSLVFMTVRSGTIRKRDTRSIHVPPFLTPPPLHRSFLSMRQQSHHCLRPTATRDD